MDTEKPYRKEIIAFMVLNSYYRFADVTSSVIKCYTETNNLLQPESLPSLEQFLLPLLQLLIL